MGEMFLHAENRGINHEMRPSNHKHSAETCVIANEIVINHTWGQSLGNVRDKITVFASDCVINDQMKT